MSEREKKISLEINKLENIYLRQEITSRMSETEKKKNRMKEGERKSGEKKKTIMNA